MENLDYRFGLVAVIATLAGTFSSGALSNRADLQPWRLMLSHDREGVVRQGSKDRIIAAVRSGCQIRIAWGGGRADPPRRSVEHVANVNWITVRNEAQVRAQIGNLQANLTTLGEPIEDHPNRAEFGGTHEVVEWRATLSTDGSFDAVWFAPHSGEFVARVPQQHPMKWYADCEPNGDIEPLYSIVQG